MIPDCLRMNYRVRASSSVGKVINTAEPSILVHSTRRCMVRAAVVKENRFFNGTEQTTFPGYVTHRLERENVLGVLQPQ